MNHQTPVPLNDDPLGVMGVTIGIAELIAVVVMMSDAPLDITLFMGFVGLSTLLMGVVLLTHSPQK